MPDLTHQSTRLDQLDPHHRRSALAEIDRVIDRALRDHAVDRAILDLARVTAEHATIARDVVGRVPEYLSTRDAMRKVNVRQTTWTDYVAAGLIAPVDPTAGRHQFVRGEVEALRDMPSGERRERVRKWKNQQQTPLRRVS